MNPSNLRWIPNMTRVETAVGTAADGVVGQMSAIFDGVVMGGPNDGSEDRDSMDPVATKEAA
jgi:hypothetical protein